MTLDHAPTVGVIGLGLIGGSLAKRAAELGLEVHAWTRSPETRAMAAEGGEFSVEDSIAGVVSRVDIVVLATPLPALEEALAEVAAAVAGGPSSPTITDVGSVKAPIAASVQRLLDDPSIFVGGHPMAGNEKSGWSAADAGLFTHTTWAVAVDEPTDVERALTVVDLACRLGAEVVPVEAAEHDRTVALTSHLPYLLAAQFGQLVGARGLGQLPLAASLAGGSLDSLTRVVSSPQAARFASELGYANRAALVDQIDRLVEVLLSARVPLSLGDQAGIESLFGWRPRGASGGGERVALPITRQDLVDLGMAGSRIVDVADKVLVVRRPTGPRRAPISGGVEPLEHG